MTCKWHFYSLFCYATNAQNKKALITIETFRKHSQAYVRARHRENLTRSKCHTHFFEFELIIAVLPFTLTFVFVFWQGCAGQKQAPWRVVCCRQGLIGQIFVQWKKQTDVVFLEQSHFFFFNGRNSLTNLDSSLRFLMISHIFFF